VEGNLCLQKFIDWQLPNKFSPGSEPRWVVNKKPLGKSLRGENYENRKPEN